MRNKSPIFATLFASVVLVGCHTDMWRQPKLVGQEGNEFFEDKMTTRPPVEGTVSWGKPRFDAARHEGRANGQFVDALPASLTIGGAKVDSKIDLAKVLRRGKERFEVFCTHCHGAVGDGKGMIAKRGLALRKPPASYHTDRLRAMPLGYFFDVITNGHGVMFPFNYRVEADDRWAIAAYIRVLQASQNVKASTLNPEQVDRLDHPVEDAGHGAAAPTESVGTEPLKKAATPEGGSH